MKKIAVLCKDGFEEIEALAPVDILRRANFDVELVGMDDLLLESSHHIGIKMDRIFDNDIYDYDGIVIPGGLPGATNLRDDDRVIEIVRDFNKNNKMLAAICAGPIVFSKADILTDKLVTCYPGIETDLPGANYQEALVQRDSNIITAKGPGAAFAFGYAILEYYGVDSSKLEDAMQYSYLLNSLKD